MEDKTAPQQMEVTNTLHYFHGCDTLSLSQYPVFHLEHTYFISDWKELPSNTMEQNAREQPSRSGKVHDFQKLISQILLFAEVESTSMCMYMFVA